METKAKSRRHFLLKFFTQKKDLDNSSIAVLSNKGAEKTKMLTPDGKLVEVTGVVRNSQKEKKKTSNAEILQWMRVKKK